jgi:DNA-binding XRE family transcriptional regulator
MHRGPNTRLRVYRVARQLTQRDLAELAGTSRETVSHVESGRTRPTLETAERLARALGASLEEVFPNDRSRP